MKSEIAILTKSLRFMPAAQASSSSPSLRSFRSRMVVVTVSAAIFIPAYTYGMEKVRTTPRLGRGIMVRTKTMTLGQLDPCGYDLAKRRPYHDFLILRARNNRRKIDEIKVVERSREANNAKTETRKRGFAVRAREKAPLRANPISPVMIPRA